MHEEMVQTLPTRIFHWMQVALVLTLIFTGFSFVYAGATSIPVHTLRLFHATPGYLLAINLILYAYYNIASGLYSRIIFGLKDIKNIKSFAKYILFLAKKHPHYGKYNPGQKAVFSLWLIVLCSLISTGIMLLFPENFGIGQRLLGGLSHLRVVHFAGAIVMACTIPVHIYLTLTEDPAKLQAIFTGYIRKT